MLRYNFASKSVITLSVISLIFMICQGGILFWKDDIVLLVLPAITAIVAILNILILFLGMNLNVYNTQPIDFLKQIEKEFASWIDNKHIVSEDNSFDSAVTYTFSGKYKKLHSHNRDSFLDTEIQNEKPKLSENIINIISRLYEIAISGGVGDFQRFNDIFLKYNDVVKKQNTLSQSSNKSVSKQADEQIGITDIIHYIQYNYKYKYPTNPIVSMLSDMILKSLNHIDRVASGGPITESIRLALPNTELSEYPLMPPEEPKYRVSDRGDKRIYSSFNG